MALPIFRGGSPVISSASGTPPPTPSVAMSSEGKPLCPATCLAPAHRHRAPSHPLSGVVNKSRVPPCIPHLPPPLPPPTDPAGGGRPQDLEMVMAGVQEIDLDDWMAHTGGLDDLTDKQKEARLSSSHRCVRRHFPPVHFFFSLPSYICLPWFSDFLI